MVKIAKMIKTFMVSGNDNLKSSEATQVADIKTKRLFVTGKGQPKLCKQLFLERHKPSGSYYLHV
jgi:hypothetical protein